MATPFRNLLARLARIALALLPWVASLHLLYWLEHGGVWSVDMPFRALLSVLVIAIGMLLSFLLHARLSARAKGAR
jgi:ABC-type uncharacterized transport system permease subunit